jgi:hypothetical protein
VPAWLRWRRRSDSRGVFGMKELMRPRATKCVQERQDPGDYNEAWDGKLSFVDVLVPACRGYRGYGRGDWGLNELVRTRTAEGIRERREHEDYDDGERAAAGAMESSRRSVKDGAALASVSTPEEFRRMAAAGRAVVETCTWKGTVKLGETVNVAGRSEHAAPDGAPVQVRFTVPEKLSMDRTSRL